jgi:peptide/nickel transport system substrate-binding protein
MTLLKNPNYRTYATYFDNKGPINFDRIKIRFIADSFTRVSEFLAGNIDIIWNIPKENVDEIMADDKFRVFEGLSDGVNWIMVNHRNAPLNDLKVRRAIALAVDREQLKTVLMGRVSVTYGMLSSSQICYSAQGDAEFAKENAMNIEKAKSLLADAGWKDNSGDGILEKGGKDLEIGMAVPLDRAPLKRSAPVLQAQLKKIGIKLKLREYETSYVKQMVRDHKYDLALRAYSWLDPSDLSYKFHTESEIYSDPVLDKLLDEGLYIMDNAKRAQKYTEAQKQIFAKTVAIPLFVEKNYHGWQKNIKGLKFETTGGNMYINDAYRE